MEQTVKLALKDVSHYYEAVNGAGVHALSHVSLSIRDGEFVAVVGASGCGKSTMLNIMSGILTPTQGEVLFNGRPLREEKHRIGYISQSETLLPWRRIVDNIALGPELDGISKAQRREKARALMRAGGLSGFEDKYPFELSGGMRKRAIILRALAHDPEIIFMDEPFGPLDVFTREALQGEILRIWQEKRITIVYITHDIAEAITLSDRILLMGPRPSCVRGEYPVSLPRPRDVGEIKHDGEFIRLEREISRQIREEGGIPE